MMNDSKDLATYIADRNAKTLAWVNAGEGRWATTLVEDLDHWAEYGIRTPLQLDWYLAACDRHEAVREADGYKPYWPQMPSTDAELEDDILFFEREAKNAYARAAAEREREARSPKRRSPSRYRGWNQEIGSREEGLGELHRTARR